MNRQFRVKSYAILIKGNKMAKSGVLLKEGQLTRPADELIKEGHIVEIIESDKKEEENSQSNEAQKASTNTSNEGGKKPLFVYEDKEEGVKIEVFEEDDLNKKQVMKDLKRKDIAFDPTKNKPTLFALLLESYK